MRRTIKKPTSLSPSKRSIMASAPSAPAVKDSTFRSYSDEQAKLYATHRLSYAPALYDVILNHHSQTGGQFGLLLDVGCGPGNATSDVALSFDEALGVDPGAAMIGAAKDRGGKTKSGKDIRYEVAPAEEVSNVKGLEPNSVDLLTAATAVSIRNRLPAQRLIRSGPLV